jgi:hypothetical protein
MWRELDFARAEPRETATVWDAMVNLGAMDSSPRDVHLSVPTRETNPNWVTWHRVRSQVEPGDRLWVRETWADTGANGICHPSDGQIVYRATDPDWDEMEGWRWRPSIHMPRWASRILLDVLAVRVERLQEINDGDIEAEGTNLRGNIGYEPLWEEMGNHRYQFANEWESTYGGTEYAWGRNPWVWVCEFKRVEGA